MMSYQIHQKTRKVHQIHCTTICSNHKGLKHTANCFHPLNDNSPPTHRQNFALVVIQETNQCIGRIKFNNPDFYTLK